MHRPTSPCLLLALVLVLGALPGCFTPLHRIHERTALEQQLTSEAIDRCVRRLNLVRPDLPTELRLEVSANADVPMQFVRKRLERTLAAQGIAVRATDRDLPTLEVQVAVAGTDLENTLIGIPLGTAGGVPITDISLLKIDSQYGRARMSALLRDIDGRAIVLADDVGGSAEHSVWTFFTFIGPFIDTDIDEFFE